jgi:hypothetical protein
MKKQISWLLLLLVAYLILLIIDWKNIKYLRNLFIELGKLFKNESIYNEDKDFILIPRPVEKNL